MIFHSTVITFENISSNVSEQDFQRIVSPVFITIIRAKYKSTVSVTRGRKKEKGRFRR